jgi:hypothetical protein
VIRADSDIGQIARLLAALPPAPVGWVEAAQELPHAWTALDLLCERAAADAELRATIVADLESALADSWVTPTPRLLATARARFEAM